MEETPNIYWACFSFDNINLFQRTIQIIKRPTVYVFVNFLYFYSYLPIQSQIFPLNLVMDMISTYN